MSSPTRGWPLLSDEFVVTKEHRRFGEFCDAVRRYRDIGLCDGPPGVGKTLSARHDARWDQVGPILTEAWDAGRLAAFPDIVHCHSIVDTPSVITSPKQLDADLRMLIRTLAIVVDRVLHQAPGHQLDVTEGNSSPERTELVIVDEADRLTVATLEQLRAIDDRRAFGLGLVTE